MVVASARPAQAGNGGPGPRPALRLALGALLLAVVLAAAVARLSSEAAPPLQIHPTVAGYVRLGGAPPALAWPREGEAAVQVPGIGSLGSSGGSLPVPIASVAKVMTAYLTLMQFPLAPGASGFLVSITPAEVQEQRRRSALGESTLAVSSGEHITEREALQALLLPSANNVAALLAVHDAGSQEAFVARMNSMAGSLGMRATTYTDPSGFEAGTVSTASDQLKLAQAAMRIAAFAAIVAEPSAELPLVGEVANYNSLLGRDGYTGIKTGSDRAAGGCLLFSRVTLIGGRRVTVLGVVLGQRSGGWIEAALSSAQRLGESAVAALHVENVLPAGARVLSASSADGQSTSGVTAAAIQQVGWGGLRVPVRLAPAPVLHRLHAGQRITTVRTFGPGAESRVVRAGASVGGPSLTWRLEHLL